MKYSTFNSIISIGIDKYILYNSISDKFIILSDKAYKDLTNSDPDYLSEKNYILYAQMKKIGGIIDKNIDEIELIKQTIYRIDNNDDFYYLHVNPTLDCIFRCWYCYENHIAGSKMSPDVINAIKRLIDNVINNQANLKTFILSFFGGEPLMYFNDIAKQLIDYLCIICHSKNIISHIHFTTNGFLLNEKILEYLQDKNVCFQITLDGAKENHDLTRFTRNGHGSYERIITNLKKLAKQDAQIILRINYTSSNIRNIHKILDDLQELTADYRRNIKINLQRVWQDTEAEHNENVNESLSENFKLFYNNGFNVSVHKVLNSVYDSCYGDKKNHCIVNYNGNVYNCTARDFLEDNRSGYLLPNGQIEWENDSLEKRMSIKFTRPVCHTCKIAPLCGGGCSQKALENKSDECIYSYTNEDIEKIILDRFEFMFLHQKM